MNPVSNYTILVVDDQVANLDVLSELLESRGFKVLAARSGETALEIAQRGQPALILLDVILPGIDGFETCRRLKANKPTEHIPVIFMTILEQIEDKIQGFQVGAADYITKPFQTEEVLARVTTQLYLRSLTRELQEANETLERRVEERTAQLVQVNNDLQAEIVERRSAEEALTRVNRAYRMLSESNRIVVHATEKTTLLQEICQTIAVHGNYLRVCVDFIEPNEAKTIRPAAQADCEGKQLEKMPVTWPDSEQRQVLSDSVIQTGKPVIHQAILSDPDLASLLTDALEHGYASVAVFPLQTGEQETIGALTVYAVQADAFAEEEIRLFMELATDMAFGVTTLRARAEHQRAEVALRESETRYMDLYEHAPDMYVSVNAKTTLIERCNHTLVNTLGYSKEEVIGRPIFELYHPDCLEEVKKTFLLFIETGEIHDKELQLRRKDGSKLDVSLNVSSVRNEEGIILYSRSTLRDITKRKQAEVALQRSNDLLRVIIEAAPVAIIGLDLDGNVQLAWNPAAEQMLGWSALEAMGHPLPSVPVESQEEFRHFREQIRRGLILDGVEVRRQRRDGTPIDYSIYASPLHDTAGHITGNIAVLVDVTEHKRVQSITQARLRLLEFANFHSMDELLTATLDEIEDLTGSMIGFYHFLEADQKTLSLQNWSTNTIKNMCTSEGKGSHYDIAQAGVWVDCIHDRRPIIHNDYASLPHRKGMPEGHAPVTREVVVPIFRGNLIKAIIGVGNKSTPYDENDVEIVSQLGDLSWDIAERKRAEEALEKQYSTLRGIIDSASALIFSVDRQHRYTSFNQQHADVMKAIYGAKIEIGHSLLEYLTVTEDREIAMHNLDRALAGEQLVEESYSGEELRSRRYYQISHNPIKTETGAVIGVAVLAQDMTKRKRAEEALAAERTLLRTVIDNLPDYIYAKDAEGRFILKNLADVRQMGAASPDEVIGKTDFDYYPPELAKKYHTDDQAVLQSGHPLINQEEPITTADGTKGWILTSKVPLRDTQQNVVGLVGIGRDITERRQAEEALQRYAQRLTILHEIDRQIVVAHSPHAIANAILERLVQLISCEWSGVILYDEEHAEAQIIALQQTLDSYTQIEKKAPLISNQILELLKTGHSIVTADLKSTEGPQTELASHLIAHGLRSGVAVPMIAQNRLIGILTLASLQADFFTPEHQSIAEEIGTQVAIAFHQAELHDRIARHNAELEQRVRERTMQLEAANEELRILSRMKDEFVSNVSHELRTPITSLKLRHHLLSARPDGWEGHLAVLTRETKRLEQIVESLLFLSRLDQERVNWSPTRVDLNQLVSQFVRDRMALAQSGELSLSFTGEPDLPLVEADVGLWEQALSILLTNAFNYTPAGGQVEVSTLTREREGQQWVGVTVNDTGPGISADEQTHLFERFFRGTAGRESGTPGTGLGLSIVQEIVNKHRGRVDVFSEGIRGKGTAFSLWLLAAESVNEKQCVPEV